MLILIFPLIAFLVAGNFVVSYIRRLRDDYSYINQDVKRFIDRH